MHELVWLFCLVLGQSFAVYAFELEQYMRASYRQASEIKVILIIVLRQDVVRSF